MWEAKILRKQRDGFRIIVYVEFSNGSESFVEEIPLNYSQNITTLKQELYKRITYLQSLDTIDTDVSVGSVAPEAPVIEEKIPLPPITVDDQKREDYKLKALQMRGIYTAMQYGVLDGSEKIVSDTRTYLKDNFLPEYITLF